MTSHTKKWKQAQLSELQQLTKKYPVIAIADLENFPASLFVRIRKKLAGKATVKVSKVRLIKKALEEDSSKKTLGKHAEKSCAVIFTEMNPFELYSFLKKNKGSAFAKEGVLAPADVIIPAGDTGLPPGPALSDLKSAGLKVRVQGQTIAISSDCVVAKKGEPFKKEVVVVLSKLDIKPIEIGLNVVAVFENGLVYGSDVLNIDTEEVFNKFATAYRNAFALSLEIGYLTKDTLPFLITKAARAALAVALDAEIYTEETLPIFLARADSAAKAINAKIPESASQEESKEEAKEEKPAEEKKEKAKEEKKEEKPAEEKKEKAKEEKKEEKPAEKKQEKKKK